MQIDKQDLYVGRSNIPGSGRGLFTRVAINKGDLVIEYTGKIRKWDDVRTDALNFYIYFVNDDHVIDAKEDQQSLARYANDAKGLTKVKGLENNSRFVNLDNRIFIQATKNIPAHTEILVEYGEGYWETVRRNRRLKT
jgi:SET domain-containing protein